MASNFSFLKTTVAFIIGYLAVYCLYSTKRQTGWNTVPASSEMVSEADEGSTKLLGSDFSQIVNGNGMANQMFNILAIIGIARKLKRVPYFLKNQTAALRGFDELCSIFPNLRRQFIVKDDVPQPRFIKRKSTDCCEFDIPKELWEAKEENIFVTGDAFQSFKYFEEFNDEVLNHILLLSPELHDKAEREIFIKNQIPTDNKILCVHTRRYDFISAEAHLPSPEDFTEAATKHIALSLFEKTQQNVTIIFFGDDRPWMRERVQRLITVLNFSVLVEDITKSSRDSKRTPFPSAIDFAFSRNHCDSVLITASASTFGWFIAYMAKPNATVYYNERIAKPGKSLPHVFADFFPSHWIPLKDENLETTKQ